MSTKIKLFDYEFKNPIVPASGTYGFGYEFQDGAHMFYNLLTTRAHKVGFVAFLDQQGLSA